MSSRGRHAPVTRRKPGECPGGLVFVVTTEPGDAVEVVKVNAPAGTAFLERLATRQAEAVLSDHSLRVEVFDGDSGELVARLGLLQ